MTQFLTVTPARLSVLPWVPASLATACLQESAQLRDKLSQLQLEVVENKGMLSELNLEVQQKTDRLAEVELRLKDCLAEKAQEEERLSRRLRDSHETIASLRAQSPPIKVSRGHVQGLGSALSIPRPGRGLPEEGLKRLGE